LSKTKNLFYNLVLNIVPGCPPPIKTDSRNT
jgi:hypothetical protein